MIVSNQPLKILCVFFIVSSIMIQGCVNSKKLLYFNNLQDTLLKTNYLPPEPKIQKNDILKISVSSLNPEASIIFNTPSSPTIPSNSNESILLGATSTSFGSEELNGYLVNFKGNIQFPVLGDIYVVGLTNEELRDTITEELVRKKLLDDPIVTIRSLNFKVTVLGEVEHPQVIAVNSDKISILEAIGLAGDLTIYGKRNDILLIREEDNGEKLIQRLDLGSRSLLTSPYFYLKTNDIIYVEPNKAKINSSNNSRQTLPIFISILSFLAILFEYAIIRTP